MAQHTCMRCGTEFTAKGLRRKYCSRECSFADHEGKSKPALVDPVRKSCAGCGKEFWTKKEEVLYCSQSCYSESRRLSYRTCPVCNTMYLPNKSSSKYCSRSCASKDKVIQGIVQKTPDTKCLQCGKTFYSNRGNRYCSRRCCADSKKSRVMRKCEYCGETFETLAKKDATFCSLRCSLMGMKQRRTKPEVAAESILAALGVKFVPQHEIRRQWHVDFLVGDNVILQIDGRYWHGHSDFEPLNEHQLAQKARDAKQDKVLKGWGYKVYRIWENEVTPETITDVLRKEGILDGTIFETGA